GHLITASGAAGLLKVLEAMKRRILPPTRGIDDPLPALASSPFRLLDEAEAWPSDGPRIAAVSSFGFGGTNAHLIVEEYVGASSTAVGSVVGGSNRIEHTGTEADEPCGKDAEVAIVGIGTVLGDLDG